MAENDLEFEDVSGAVAPLDMPQSPAIETPAAPETKPADRVAAELEAYKRHFSALQSDLAAIEEQYRSVPANDSNALEKRVSGIEKGMEEIKELLKQQHNPAVPAPVPTPQPQMYYPQVPQYPFSPVGFSTPAPMMPPLVTYR